MIQGINVSDSIYAHFITSSNKLTGSLGYKSDFKLNRDDLQEAKHSYLIDIPSSVGSMISAVGLGNYNFTNPDGGMNPFGQKVLYMAAAMTTSVLNAICFESWGQRIMNHTIENPGGKLMDSVSVVKNEFTSDWARARVVIRASVVEALVHRGIVKYGPFWMVRDLFNEKFPEDKFSHNIMKAAGPALILTAGEISLVTPFTAGLYKVLDPSVSQARVVPAMRHIVKTEGVSSLWKMGGALGMRTLCFSGAQNGGVTLVEVMRRRYTPNFEKDNPFRAKAEKSIVGTLFGVWASMAPQIIMTRVSKDKELNSWGVFKDMLKNPKQTLIDCSGPMFRAKASFKLPNCLGMMIIPGIIVTGVNGYLEKK